MSSKKAFDRGLLTGLLLMLGGQGVHWFITPQSHPDAGSFLQALAKRQSLASAGRPWRM